MIVLGFERGCRRIGGHRVRAARFESRSALPVSAACVVANGVRQTLSDLFGTPVSLRLIEPVLPDPKGWACICDGASIYAVRGSDADGAYVMRRRDALALAGAALGERIEDVRALSAVENRLLARTAAALSAALTPVCGTPEAGMCAVGALQGFVTYFEVIVETPVAARIGIALSREPRASTGATIAPETLGAAALSLCVEAAHGFLPAAALARLRPGDVVAFDSRVGDAALIRSGKEVLGRGQCGEIEMRRAVAVQ